MDDVDRAKKREMEHRKDSLNNTLSASDRNPGDQQRTLDDGTVICVDCLGNIPPERLAVKPNAVRCIDCKKDWERKHK